MESSLFNDGEFWLPPEFLTDEDFLVEKENKVFQGMENGGGSKFFYSPYASRPGFRSLGLNSGLVSPVESLVGSTGTESDEENYIAGLTRQMAHSTLEDDLSCGFGGRHKFTTDNNTEAWGLSGSPQSTLCAAGIFCGCQQRLVQNSQSRVQPMAASAAWDLYSAASEEMTRMKINDEPYGFNHGSSGLLSPLREPCPSPVAVKNPNIGSVYYNQASLPYQKLQAIQFQQLKQQQMMKHRQAMQNRGRINVNGNGRSVGLWPNMQHAQQPRDASGMRAVFLSNPTGKRGSTGTGVFLPRRVTPTSGITTETRKKPTLSTVLVPARVAHALNLNLDDTAPQPAALPRFEFQTELNDISSRFRSNNVGFSSQNLTGIKAEQPAISTEHRLPTDWSY